VSDLAGLKKNVGFLNWAVGVMFILGLSAIGTTYVLLSGDLSNLNASVSGQSASIGAMGKTLDRIEERIDGNQPQTGAGTREVGPVRH